MAPRGPQPTQYTRRALVGTALISACVTLAFVSTTRLATLGPGSPETPGVMQSIAKDFRVNMMLDTGHTDQQIEQEGPPSWESEQAMDEVQPLDEFQESQESSGGSPLAGRLRSWVDPSSESDRDGADTAEEEQDQGEEQQQAEEEGDWQQTEGSSEESEAPEQVAEDQEQPERWEETDSQQPPAKQQEEQQEEQQQPWANEVEEPVAPPPPPPRPRKKAKPPQDHKTPNLPPPPPPMEDEVKKPQHQQQQVMDTTPRKRAHILVPVKGLEKPHMQCPDGLVVDETIAFWKEWTSEAPLWKPVEPLPNPTQTYYLTFEPDLSGFNNVRMSVECAIAFAVITGRTLVLPDDWSIDHLRAHGNRDVSDFYELAKTRRILPMMTMTEFLEKEAVTGGLSKPPPDNKTSWILEPGETHDEVWKYIREVAAVIEHGPNEYVMAFEPHEDHQRLEEFRGERKVVAYDDMLRHEKVVHMTTYADGGVRWLAHFYGYFFFGDVSRDNWVKRFMRDMFHYNSDIMCPAARVVQEIKKEAGGSWVAMHIRRGDFESSYAPTVMPVEQLFENIEGLIEPGALVYISTNEKDLSYFEPVANRFRLRFLSNYTDSAGLDDTDPSFYGMMEQVICGSATRFVGTYWSTFTNYINRLRGYAGREPGYYFVKDHEDELLRVREHYAKQPFFYREWEDVYVDIDMGWADDGKYAGEVAGWGEEQPVGGHTEVARRKRRRERERRDLRELESGP